MCEFSDSVTILIVDNDDHGRKYLSEALAKLGYRTCVARSGVEALEMDIDRVDLLISDLIMPGMLGAEFSQKFRKRFPTMKQIFISGFPEHAARHIGYLPEGPFLEKPISPTLLRKKVLELLPALTVACSV